MVMVNWAEQKCGPSDLAVEKLVVRVENELDAARSGTQNAVASEVKKVQVESGEESVVVRRVPTALAEENVVAKKELMTHVAENGVLRREPMEHAKASVESAAKNLRGPVI
jgi:hypothetical protein